MSEFTVESLWKLFAETDRQMKSCTMLGYMRNPTYGGYGAEKSLRLRSELICHQTWIRNLRGEIALVHCEDKEKT
jgi:hypothetical protein